MRISHCSALSARCAVSAFAQTSRTRLDISTSERFASRTFRRTTFCREKVRSPRAPRPLCRTPLSAGRPARRASHGGQIADGFTTGNANMARSSRFGHANGVDRFCSRISIKSRRAAARHFVQGRARVDATDAGNGRAFRRQQHFRARQTSRRHAIHRFLLDFEGATFTRAGRYTRPKARVKYGRAFRRTGDEGLRPDASRTLPRDAQPEACERLARTPSRSSESSGEARVALRA